MTASSIDRRWKKHVYRALNKTSKSPLHFAIRKYGVESFTIKKIGSASTRAQLIKMEKKAILKYDSSVKRGKGYNATNGGDGGDTFGGRRHSASTRRKMSRTRLSRIRSGNITYKKWNHSKKSRKLMSRVQKNHPTSQRTKDKIAASVRAYYSTRPGSFTGRSHTKESILKMSPVKRG